MRELQHEKAPDRSRTVTLRWALLGGLLLVHFASRFEPGGYLVWSDIQSLSAVALLPGAVWMGWKLRGFAIRLALAALLGAVALLQWGVPALRDGACRETIDATLASADVRLISTSSDCGATTAEAYKVVLIDGADLFRRRRVVIESYVSPVPSLVALDSLSLNVDLRFIPRDSVVHLEIPLSELADPRSYFRGEPIKD